MYKLTYTHQFKKDLRKCQKRGLDMQALHQVIRLLAETGTLPQEYRPHMLAGTHKNIWECHIKPDWLLLWKQNDEELILIMTNTGTHSDIFKK